ncbi:hypothetical protein [Legionella cardiaca]|uniref:Dot/Icm T4SS effector n=1 Tax=Legionella cardiaca TaxID=1071983 RepID=A0ABY8AUS4_9GAMM|nr:hypothetical protein [Legionella cardiaca]WED44435.1 hypothetical protein PXX05_06530 [Legionella cardiaca]
MGKKILFAFGGTGDKAERLSESYQKKLDFNDDVVRVYFSGCQDYAIGGKTPGIGYISPNLDVVSSKLRECFNDTGELSLAKLKQKFGSAIIIKGANDDDDSIQIDDITLTGFSRGGVTTFAVARHLDDLDIPISLYASDPVPGNSKQNAQKQSSEFYKNHDLSGCKNLQHATVVLGAYKKNVSPLHNKFFRQMAPLFQANCDHAIYTVPKTHHLRWNPMAENEEQQFLYNRGIAKNERYYSEDTAPLFFVPKILQQKTHIGVEGRTGLSARFKEKLIDTVAFFYPLVSRSDPVKIGQALYALQLASDFADRKTLNIAVRKSTIEAKVLREFIVEFENINSYVFRKEKNEPDALKDFRRDVYQLLVDYSITDASLHEKQALQEDILARVKALKGRISSNNYNELNKLVKEFLKENVLFHPDLTQYIDETETYNSKPASSYQATPLVSIRNITDPAELAHRLYHMSDRARAASYESFAANLPHIVKSTEELANIIRFLPPDKMEKALKIPEMKQLITNMDNVNLIMEKLFTSDQKKQLFSSIKNNIGKMDLNFEQLGRLIPHIPHAQAKELLESVSFNAVTNKSSRDVIEFLDKLTSQQIKQLLPVIEKKLQEYAKDAKVEDVIGLYKFCQEKFESVNAAILEKIFPNANQAQHIQNKFKSALNETCERNQEEPDKQIIHSN